MAPLISPATAGLSVAYAMLFALGTFVATKAARFMKYALIYHAVVFGFFFMIYRLIPGGFRSHFNVPDAKKKFQSSATLYYTAVVHSTTGFGDIYPTTWIGDMIVTIHIALVFLANFLPFGTMSA